MILSKQISKRNYKIELIFIALCADWSAWEFQEGIAGSKENLPPQPDFAESTYESLLATMVKSRILRIESED
jgi:hypothetical protein